jgi:hypothetical protein
MARLSSRTGKRLTRKNEGLTLAQLRAKRLAKQPMENLTVVLLGGRFTTVTARGSDINKIQARNTAFAKYYKGDKQAIDRFSKRYSRPYVIDRRTGEAVHLIMDPNELKASRDAMTKRQRKRLLDLYAEDMAA